MLIYLKQEVYSINCVIKIIYRSNQAVKFTRFNRNSDLKIMQPIEINDPTKIEQFLSKIALTGKGFTTECLLMDAYDAGLDYPDYLKAEGEDPDATYEGKSPAWAKYHMRQGKRVFMVYGDKGKDRRTHFSETP